MNRLPSLILLLLLPWFEVYGAQRDATTNKIAAVAALKPLADALTPAKWQQVEKSVDRALAWIASQQEADGSFRSVPQGQPAVTSLCVMAFLSRGHQPGRGGYGPQLDHAIDYVLACQLPSGLFSKQVPGPTHQNMQASHTASYNHAITGLMLGEVYGQVSGSRAQSVKLEIERALQFTRTLQRIRPKPPIEEGGWRYLRPDPPSPADSDMSITAWQLMFLRSARNAEFAVPEEYIEEALSYVRRCWDPGTGRFFYALPGSRYGFSRGTTAAGIVSLSMGGQHQTSEALAAGDWLLAHPFRQFGQVDNNRERFFYTTYYCSQAAAQLGGKYWERIFPALSDSLLSGQISNGSWPPEAGGVAIFGNCLTTALAVLSLTPPYQLLPVYQR